MTIQELTEEQAERICDHYHKKYKVNPCSNCPFNLSEDACAEYLIFNELRDEDAAAARGE